MYRLFQTRIEKCGICISGTDKNHVTCVIEGDELWEELKIRVHHYRGLPQS